MGEQVRTSVAFYLSGHVMRGVSVDMSWGSEIQKKKERGGAWQRIRFDLHVGLPKLMHYLSQAVYACTTESSANNPEKSHNALFLYCRKYVAKKVIDIG